MFDILKENDDAIEMMALSKVTTWCAVYQHDSISPYFFKEDGIAVTVTSVLHFSCFNDSR